VATYDLFSKRRKRELGKTPDVYSYSDIPRQLRVQIINIWWDALGNTSSRGSRNFQIDQMYTAIVSVLRREYGVFSLVHEFCVNSHDELTKFFLKETNINCLLDVIEITTRMIDGGTRNFDYLYRTDCDAIADEAIADLNLRMKEHGVGYYYSDGVILRVDAEVIHKEAVIPALTDLRTKGYESAQREFLSAHEHHRAGRNAEALVDCCKAFESVLKIICTKRGWPFDPKATASNLVDACLANGLIPTARELDSLGIPNQPQM
jgi:AbiJ N-terminal domain 4